jgi:hypothetical protein
VKAERKIVSKNRFTRFNRSHTIDPCHHAIF